MRLFLGFLAILSPAWLHAEVSNVSEHGFDSHHRLILAAEPDAAYDALVNDVAMWWDAEHSYTGQAAAFSIDDSAGGCFCEVQGEISVEHMRVVNSKPGSYLVMRGGLGPLQGVAVTGSMRFEFRPHEEGTELLYTYRVGGFIPGGLDAWAEPVDLVQLGQLKRLQNYIATKR